MKVKTIKKYRQVIKKGIICAGILVIFSRGGLIVEASGNTDEPIRLDNFTGEVATENVTNKDEVRLFSDCVYDKNTKEFVYTLEEAAQVQARCSVADGMITNQSVSIELSSETDFSLHKNGIKVDNVDFSSIKEYGNYILLYKGKKVLEFRIIGEYSTLEVFYTPPGFYVKEVLIDGTPAAFTYESVSMDTEGTYDVSYVCEGTGRTYSFKTTVDRTSPVLVLEELDEKGRARGPVDISDREADTTVEIKVDGVEQKVSDILKQSGKYVVTISDRAGNFNTYNFTIMLYFNTSSIAFFGLILAITGAMVAYIVISAKRIKVF